MVIIDKEKCIGCGKCVADSNADLKKWLGIEKETICACMLLGHPKQKYVRTAPRRKADVTIL